MDDALPPLFEMDDFSSCIENENNLYCNVLGKLKFSKSNKTVIEFLENVTANKQKFDRNVIHRGLCISKEEIEDYTNLKYYSKKLVNHTLTTFTRTDLADVEIVSCTEKSLHPSYYDEVVLVLSLSYFALVAYATFNHMKYNSNKTSEKADGLILNNFSLQKNWMERTIDSKNTDFQKLLSMQGFRFILMLGIVLFHVLLINTLSFTSNPSDYENTLKYLYTPLLVFLVLPFFLFSSWLLTIQMHNLFEKEGEISFKNVCVIILNRYFRLAFTVAFSVCVQLSSWVSRIRGPLTFTPLNYNTEACRKHWLSALLFTGNYVPAMDVCLGVAWYLSADFQVYVINLLCLYFKFAFKIKDKVFYTCLLISACFLHGTFLYTHGHDIIFTVNIRHFEESNFRTTPDWVVYYTSTYSVWACSIIGLIFGEIYYKTKKYSVENITVWKVILWTLGFMGPIFLALLMATRETRGLEAAILGSIVKPVYNIGFAIGILGMSQNIGGVIKKFLENKYFVLLGNFTFCTYIIHMLPLIWLHSRYDWPWSTNLYQIILDYILVSLLCWPAGILLTLVIENPGLMIQKLILPQVRKRDYKKKSYPVNQTVKNVEKQKMY